MEQVNVSENSESPIIVIKKTEVDAPIIITRKPLDPNPFATHLDKQPKAKSNYKEEKNLKNLKKTAAYKDSYKEKEQAVKYNKQGDLMSELLEKVSLGEDLILIIKDKMENNTVQFSGFEKKTLQKIFDKYEKKTFINVRDTRDAPVVNQDCFTGDNCIVWYCKFGHSDARKKECKCNEAACDKLHARQALCKNKNHADDCQIAHRAQDIKN